MSADSDLYPYDNRRREVWSQKGYSPRHASAAVTLPPDKPDLRVYHLLPSQHALNNIALMRMKLANIAELNDPFELIGMNFESRPSRDYFRKLKCKLGSNFGFISYCEDWAPPVIWSHYADCHKGMALGFDIDTLVLRKVDYVEERLSVEFEETGFPEPMDFLMQMMTTKSKHWEYEAEWRTVINLKATVKEGGLNFLPMTGQLKLREVILGPLCPLNVLDVRNLVDKNFTDVVTYKARLAFKSFNVVPDETTLPGVSPK